MGTSIKIAPFYKNVFKISIAVTPGTPTTAAMDKESKLSGKVTPVNPPIKLTKANVAIPFSIERNIFFRGFLALTISWIENNSNNMIPQIIKDRQSSIFSESPFYVFTARLTYLHQ